MPLHKSSRAPRLDPTMISAPLGDFRHTMHIGRGGDAFGDTSFLSTLGPGSAGADPGSPGIAPAAEPEASVNHGELQHSESVSSFTMDLDLDLGPSMLGDVLGVMDGLGLDSNEEDVFIHRVPLHRCDGGAVLLEVGHRSAALQETGSDTRSEDFRLPRNTQPGSHKVCSSELPGAGL
uniref:CDC42 effector protein (Rho GTPase binding) 5 n=1 Tax=Acanthochromis polyacanthus TaxID=80966 RepID=A0A3Q1G520_9TELE